MELHVSLDGPGDRAARIYLTVREAVLDGRLAAGDRVPASRDLARQLGVARGTVTVAYDRLVAEGFLESRPGSGTYVTTRRARPRRGPPGAGPGPSGPLPLWDHEQATAPAARPPAPRPRDRAPGPGPLPARGLAAAGGRPAAPLAARRGDVRRPRLLAAPGRDRAVPRALPLGRRHRRRRRRHRRRPAGGGPGLPGAGRAGHRRRGRGPGLHRRCTGSSRPIGPTCAAYRSTTRASWSTRSRPTRAWST